MTTTPKDMFRHESRKYCPTCGATVCDVRVPGEDWIVCDWPPLLPIVGFGRAIVASNCYQHAFGDDDSALYSFDGFRVPGHIASVLVLTHRCPEPGES